MSEAPANYEPRGNDDCSVKLSSNVKVNQNCLTLSDATFQGRGQANNETSIAIDPNNTNHMVASANDYRRGDGNCYASWSTDKGRTWNDSTTPTSFTKGRPLFGATREYWGGGGDTSVAWDTKGNAYLSCQLFNRGRPTSSNPDASSGLYVYRATQNNGASWNFPGRPVRESADLTGHGTNPFLDKQLMTVDATVGSPFQDRVYVSWTEFAASGSAYIFEAYSKDYGEHFSLPTVVSTTSPLCVNNYGQGTENGQCNENQFSQPFTGPDGALYIVYANFNNGLSGPNDNRNQFLLSKSTDGGNTFAPPVKVGDYYDLPDCATYQSGNDFGRACVPEKAATTNSIFRATNYPSGAVNPTKPREVVVSYGSYINSHSKESNGCVPTGFAPSGNNAYTGVKTPGACNNDILLSVSENAGTTFTGTIADPRTMLSVTSEPGQTTTDQWWQWLAFNKEGKLAISYYDRQYGTDETTGYSDVSLSGSGSLTDFGVKRVTSGSMPPPTQFGGVFFGDYTGLAAADNAYPLWMDTRSPELFLCPGTGAPGVPPAVCTGQTNGMTANDQDIYVASIGIPSR